MTRDHGGHLEGTFVNIGQLFVEEVLQANIVARGRSYNDRRGSLKAVVLLIE